MIYLLSVNHHGIRCEMVERKPLKSRLFASGAGLTFYVSGVTTGVIDKLANVVMNKAIEVNGTTRGVALHRTEKPAKPAPKSQLKLL